MRRSYARLGHALALLLATGASACTIELVDTLIGGGGDTNASGGTESGDAGDAGDPADEAGGEEAGGSGNDEPLPNFDVGSGSEIQVSSCEFAAEFPSHIGCEFFGVDVDGPGLFDFEPYGFVVINPLPEPTHVQLERYAGRTWVVVDEAMVAGEREHVFSPAHCQAHGTGIHTGSALRITSTRPIIAIQAHPAAGEAISASATMLQPTSAWATQTPVAGWRTHLGVGERAFLGVVARTPGTAVTLRPTFAIADAPPSWADEWLDVDDDGEPELVLPIDPGELLRLDAQAIDAAEVDHGTSGSIVDSGQEHLTSAFSAHSCAAIPDYDGSCGHMQEQLSAALVGTRFVAPRLIATKNPGGGLDPDPLAPLVHERTMIQVVALEPNTEVVFSYADDGVGVELESVVIDPDEPYAIYVSERDLAVTASEPILATAYMTNAALTYLGSPSMVALAPVDQWTEHHWVWAPAGFETHLLVSASPSASVEVEWLSGLADDETPQPAPDPLELELVANSGQPGQSWAIHRFVVGPGIHRVRTSGPASVIVAGWRAGDGFAYLGGWGPSFADLGPEG